MEEQNSNCPFETQELDPETEATFSKCFEEDFRNCIRIGPKGYFMHRAFLKDAHLYYNMQMRPHHVFVGGLPRSGTTWTQQLVWLIKNDLDYSRCDETHMSIKFPHLEMRTILPKHFITMYSMEDMQIKSSPSTIENMMQSFSYFKTHLPLSLLPPKFLETSKMVYVARDPRDVIVSSYYMSLKLSQFYKSDFKTFWNCCLKGTMFYCPNFEHVKEFWEKRDHPNLLFLFYEDILNDRLNTLRRVAKFFNKSYTDEQLLILCNHLDFNNFKNNKTMSEDFMKELGAFKPDAEPFIRKGIIGDWRNHFDEEMSREADQWIADNLRDTDLRFPTIDLKF